MVKTKKSQQWNHSTQPEFYEDYAEKSLSEDTNQRFMSLYNIATRFINADDHSLVKVIDVGCGAGTQSRIWAEKGYDVVGLDVNEPLINLAKERMQAQNLNIDFQVGSATELPWDDNTFDVCLVPELLEHVEDWESCVNEFSRVLKPGGVLLMSTTNKLCPNQQEFNLPLYSWYPKFLKKYFEKKAVTTKPELANYAKYPAVHWFSFYSLRDYLAKKGFKSFDRFDVIDLSNKSKPAKLVVNTIKYSKVIRFFAHVLTPYTFIVSQKK